MTITENIFNKVLIEPIENGADHLFVVAGYATATMAYHHLSRLPAGIKVNLIIGMCSKDGIGKGNLNSFRKLVTTDYIGRFNCRLVHQLPPVHSKTYAWYRGTQPCKGFSGSANYTQNAFGPGQKELMVAHDATGAYNYYQELYDSTIDCLSSEIESLISLYNESEYQANTVASEQGISYQDNNDVDNSVTVSHLQKVKISFLDRYGDLPARSGLNWGQRPGREPNQAYIKLTSEIYNSDFFPPVGKYFNIVTEDNCSFVAVRSQDNGKAIETPYNNSILGKYFRKRLHLSQGDLVKIEHLVAFGRTDVEIYKIDEENYYLNFSN